jgi:hypothetical protein
MNPLQTKNYQSMGEYFPAEIHIGGNLKRSDVPRFCVAINRGNLSLEYGDDCVAVETEVDLLGLVAAGKPLILRDAEAIYGQFKELEAFCQTLGLSYDRQSSGKNDYTPELVRWRPGMRQDQPEVWHTLDDGQRLVLVADVDEAIRRAQAALRKGQDSKCILDVLRELTRTAKDVPRFQIIDG